MQFNSEQCLSQLLRDKIKRHYTVHCKVVLLMCTSHSFITDSNVTSVLFIVKYFCCVFTEWIERHSWLPVWLYRGKSGSICRHCGLLQITQATVQLLRHPDLTKLDSLLAEEKGLLQSLDDDDGGLSCVSQLTKTLDRQLKLPAAERYVSYMIHIMGHQLASFCTCLLSKLIILIYSVFVTVNAWWKFLVTTHSHLCQFYGHPSIPCKPESVFV